MFVLSLAGMLACHEKGAEDASAACPRISGVVTGLDFGEGAVGVRVVRRVGIANDCEGSTALQVWASSPVVSGMKL